MSGVSFIFVLSPTPTLQSRCAFLATSRAELCRFSWGGRPGVTRAEKYPGVSNPRNRVAAKAGLGRLSGSIHGGNKQRGRKRRPTLRPDGCDENSSGDEQDSAFKHREDNKMGTYEESGMDGVVHDDGVPATDLTDSHQRYLSELGINQDEAGREGIIHDDSEPATDPTDSYRRYLRELGIIQSEAGREYQSHACNVVPDGSTWVSIGTEGDLGYQQVNNVAENNRVDVGIKGADGAWKEGDQVVAGVDGGRSGKEDSKKVEDSKSSRGKKVQRNKVNLSEPTGFVAEVDPVAVTVISDPELFSEQSLKDVAEDVNSVTSGGDIQPDSSIQSAENGALGKEDMNVLATSEVNGKSKKQRRKTRRKSGMNTAAADELSKDETRVRIVSGEAEQPSVAEMLSVSQRRRREKANPTAENISVGAVVELETTVKAVIGQEERKESGMAKDLYETLEPENGTEECVSVPKVILEEPVSKSKVTPSGSIIDPVEVSQEESPAAFSVLNSEQANDVVGESSEIVRTEAKNGDLETDVEAGIENTIDNGQLRIEGQDNVGRTTNSNGALLESQSSIECSDDEFHDRSSVTTQNGPAILALAIGAENVQSRDATVFTSPVVEQAVQVVSKVAEVPTQIASKLVELPTQVANKVVELPTHVASQAVELPSQVVSKVAELPAQVASKVVELPAAIVEQATQVGTLVVEQVAEILPNAVTEQVGQVVSQVVDLQTQFSDQVSLVADQVHLVGQMMVDQVAKGGESVVEQVSAAAEQVVQVAESVTSTANQVVEQVAEKVTDILSFDEDDMTDSDDEFESYKTSDDPAFRGSRGLANFVILQEDQGVLARIYDFYTYMLKQPLPKFSAAMFSAPIIVSVLFTLLYLPEYKGLAFDDTARDFFAATGADALTLRMSWGTVFQLFMFSLSLSTGLQPELAPMSPYTLVVANLNALVAQLVFVFLSGAVFARLSQPAQPVRCSRVALVSTSPAQRKRKDNAIKVLMTRYVLAGPQPCELVDVKVDLTYKYNTITRTGSYFRATQSLKLVRPEIAFLTHGMLVRHVIDSTSPLYQRTAAMLKKEDAVFVLSVVGLERSSMQSIFHVQHYCVCDDDVVWDAEFEDLFLINSKKNKRIVDHSRLSMWRPI